MPAHKVRKLQIRENLILESAAKLVDKVGFAHLTMELLSEEVGIAKATLYQHFKSKEEVFIASTQRGLDNLERFMRAATGSAIDQLRAIMRYMMLSSYDADGFPTIILHDEVLHLFNNDPVISAKFQQLNTLLFALVDRAKQEGDIAPDLPNEVIITMMMNSLPATKAPAIYGVGSQETVVAHTLRIFFRGVRP